LVTQNREQRSEATGAVFVTLSGECFVLEFQRTESTTRDGVLDLFAVTDLKSNRGTRLVSLFRSGQSKLWVENYESRILNIRLNAIRRAFDSRVLSFDAPYEEHSYKELSLQPSDFHPQPSASVEQIKRLIKNEAYWLGFKCNPKLDRYHVCFDTPTNLEYLGVKAEDINRYVFLLSQQGFIDKENISGRGRTTDKLIAEYESENEDETFARMAIEEARKSIPESDGRVHPKVGVVVVRDGRVLCKAHRGEFPEGHAEFIALEKKLKDAAVSGATVYTTLEPCTTRNHPKVPYASRLVERKISRVVIGMLDPDSRITGRGQRRLRDARIIVGTFPPELADEVEELNREFTRYAEQKNKTTQKVNNGNDTKVDTILSYKGKPVTVINRDKQARRGFETVWQETLVADCNQQWVVLQEFATKK